MKIIINNYEDLKKHTILLEPSQYSWVSFWSHDLKTWDYRAKVIKGYKHENLEFFDINSSNSKKYKIPSMDDPGWERCMILGYLYPEDGTSEVYTEWRIFKKDLDLRKLARKGELEFIDEVLLGIEKRLYTDVAVYKSIGSMIGKRTMKPFKDIWDVL